MRFKPADRATFLALRIYAARRTLEAASELSSFPVLFSFFFLHFCLSSFNV